MRTAVESYAVVYSKCEESISNQLRRGRPERLKRDGEGARALNVPAPRFVRLHIEVDMSRHNEIVGTSVYVMMMSIIGEC